jgi:hypothetical protein
VAPALAAELTLLSWRVAAPDACRVAINLPMADVGIDESLALIAATLAS